MFFYNNSISYSNEYSPTNFTVSSDSNGYPSIPNLMGSTITDTIDVNRLCIYELYRRIFPTIRSSGLLQLTSSTNSSPSNGQIWYDSGSNTFNFIKMGQHQLFQLEVVH